MFFFYLLIFICFSKNKHSNINKRAKPRPSSKKSIILSYSILCRDIRMLSIVQRVTWRKLDCSVWTSKPAVTIENIVFIPLIHINCYFIDQPAGLNALIIPADANRAKLHIKKKRKKKKCFNNLSCLVSTVHSWKRTLFCWSKSLQHLPLRENTEKIYKNHKNLNLKVTLNDRTGFMKQK